MPQARATEQSGGRVREETRRRDHFRLFRIRPTSIFGKSAAFRPSCGGKSFTSYFSAPHRFDCPLHSDLIVMGP